MKAKLTRDQDLVPKLTKQQKRLAVQRYQRGEISRQELRDHFARRTTAGTVIEHPKAFMLVRLGVAEPVDEECKAAAEMDDRKLVAAQEASEKIEKGQATGREEHDAKKN